MDFFFIPQIFGVFKCGTEGLGYTTLTCISSLMQIFIGLFREEFKEKNEIKQIGLWSLFSPSYLENDTSYNKSVQLPTGLF
jgi:hypothetical protein